MKIASRVFWNLFRLGVRALIFIWGCFLKFGFLDLWVEFVDEVLSWSGESFCCCYCERFLATWEFEVSSYVYLWRCGLWNTLSGVFSTFGKLFGIFEELVGTSIFWLCILFMEFWESNFEVTLNPVGWLELFYEFWCSVCRRSLCEVISEIW